MRNRVDLIGCLVQEKDRRDREERSVDYFEMYQNTPNWKTYIKISIMF